MVPGFRCRRGSYWRATGGVRPITRMSTEDAISSFSQIVMNWGPNSFNREADFTSLRLLIFTGNLATPPCLQIPLIIALFIVPMPINP